MMKLNSARRAWHDAFYNSGGGLAVQIEQIGRLGCSVQTSTRRTGCGRAAHQSVAARIQQAISTLPWHLRTFGNFMYSPTATIDEQEQAEELVFCLAYEAGPRMTARKFDKARYVARAILFRYRRINQGGQGAGLDPLPSVELMRKWILDSCGVALPGDQWARDWGGFVQHCFMACDRLDSEALAVVSRALKLMNQVA
jgi:hypothetical protein